MWRSKVILFLFWPPRRHWRHFQVILSCRDDWYGHLTPWMSKSFYYFRFYRYNYLISQIRYLVLVVGVVVQNVFIMFRYLLRRFYLLNKFYYPQEIKFLSISCISYCKNHYHSFDFGPNDLKFLVLNCRTPIKKKV